MGWLSIVCAAFLAATFLMDPERRKFPASTDLTLFNPDLIIILINLM